MTTVNVSIPTAKRPQMIARLLENVSRQLRVPDELFVIDASPDQETFRIVEEFKSRFCVGVLRYLSSSLGLTLQRNVGLDNTSADLIFMLDDDVVLEPDCILVMEQFMTSPAGAGFGGISPMITNNYGRELSKIQRLYKRLGIFESLEPGSWLYCGEFIEMSYLKPFKGIFPGTFLHGCGMMYRREVFDLVRPDNTFVFEADDKHLSLRVGWTWKLGILGDAHLVHEQTPLGIRKPPVEQAIRSIRNKARILIDCTRNRWVAGRYTAFILFQIVDLSRNSLAMLIKMKFKYLPSLLGSWIGLLWNLFLPPVRKREKA